MMYYADGNFAFCMQWVQTEDLTKIMARRVLLYKSVALRLIVSTFNDDD